MHLLPVFYLDILKSIEVAQHGWTKPAMPKYQTTPSLDDAWSFFHQVHDNAGLLVTADIETIESSGVDEDDLDQVGMIITQIQFSTAPCTGIVLPWEGKYKDVARAILATGNTKAGHNWWKFDAPRLSAAGYDVNGLVHDTMQMWRRYHPDLPTGLQFVASLCGFPIPWKHLASSDAGLYGAADVDAPQRIMAVLPEWMRQKGCWRSYEQHVLGLEPILVRMSERGLPINNQKRLEVRAEDRRNGARPDRSDAGPGARRDQAHALARGHRVQEESEGRCGRRTDHAQRGPCGVGQAQLRDRGAGFGARAPVGQSSALQLEQFRADQKLHPLSRASHSKGAPDRTGHHRKTSLKSWPKEPATSSTPGWWRSANSASLKAPT